MQGSGIYIHEEWVKNPLIFNSLTRTPYKRINSKMLSLKKVPSAQMELFTALGGAKVRTTGAI